ncbi:MAG: abortive infection family protein [Firmicutes bacterium]|nr:abortive infection family protein [Bacillota bacterium]
MLSSYTIRELSKIICGDVEYMPYLSGPQLVDTFNNYGFRDMYGQGFPSRRVYTEEKLLELNGTQKMIKLIEDMVHPRRFLNTELSFDVALAKVNELLSYEGYVLKKNGNTYKIYVDEPIAIEPETLVSLQVDYVTEQINKCDDKISKSDFDGAITNARTLVETVMLKIVSEYNSNYEHSGDLIKLFKEVRTILNLEVSKDKYPESIIQIVSGITTIVNGIANVRNSMSDAHAKKYKPSKHHAKLAVNSAKTVSEFLIDSYTYIKSKGA